MRFVKFFNRLHISKVGNKFFRLIHWIIYTYDFYADFMKSCLWTTFKISTVNYVLSTAR